jgi:hypothetical protein
MRVVKRLRRLRARGPVVAPLAALVATTVVAIATAATTGLALCRHNVAMSMPMSMPMNMPMPDMPAAAPGTIDLCPIVMGLIVLAVSLGGWALAAIALERHRMVLRHTVLALLAGLPLVRTIVGLAAVSAVPIALIIVFDASAPSSTENWLLLGALIAGGAALATGAIVLGARCALAFGRRLILRIGATRIPAGVQVLPSLGLHRPRFSFASGLGDVCVLAVRLGFRAPPLTLR